MSSLIGIWVKTRWHKTMTEKFKNKYRINSTRLQTWNYGWNGGCFVTICTKNRECFFGVVENGDMQHSKIGKITYKYWCEIPEHFPFVRLDEFVIMPNHVHGIVIIDKSDDAAVETLQCNVSTASNKKIKFMSKISPKSGTLSTIIRPCQSAVSKDAHKINKNFN